MQSIRGATRSPERSWVGRYPYSLLSAVVMYSTVHCVSSVLLMLMIIRNCLRLKKRDEILEAGSSSLDWHAHRLAGGTGAVPERIVVQVRLGQDWDVLACGDDGGKMCRLSR